MRLYDWGERRARDPSSANVGGGTLQFPRKPSVVLHRTAHKDFTQDAAPPTLPGTFHVIQDHSWTIKVRTP
jgi:hypothetical protein